MHECNRRKAQIFIISRVNEMLNILKPYGSRFSFFVQDALSDFSIINFFYTAHPHLKKTESEIKAKTIATKTSQTNQSVCGQCSEQNPLGPEIYSRPARPPRPPRPLLIYVYTYLYLYIYIYMLFCYCLFKYLFI